MTYPDEFNSQTKQIGDQNIKHPIYKFSVNLDLTTTEAVGPNTNQSNVGILHPDQYQSSPDLGRTQTSVRDLHRISWLPGLLAAGNISINDDGTITAWGQVGVYLKNTYTTGTNPLLTLVNSPPYTSA